MSRSMMPATRSALVMTGLLIALALPTSVMARQSASQSATELRAHLDALRPERARAAEEAAARERRDAVARRAAAAAIATVDTIQVGVMTIVTPVEQVELARELFTEVWDESYALISGSPELERAWFSFQWSDSRVPIHIEEHPRPVELNSQWIRRSNVKRNIREVIGATINYDMSSRGTAVGRWLSGNPFFAQEDENTYRMIATTQSRSTRACLEGDRAECISALRLTLGTAPRWTPESSMDERQAYWESWEERTREHLRAWYAPEERRAMVARYPSHPSRADRVVWVECIEAGRMAACDDYLITRGQDLAPMGSAVRQSFMAYALERGAEGAWARLIEDPDATPIEALEHASGQDIHTLVGDWREQILAARPESFARLIPKGGLALLWFVFFSAFALRSTRWRLG